MSPEKLAAVIGHTHENIMSSILDIQCSVKF